MHVWVLFNVRRNLAFSVHKFGTEILRDKMSFRRNIWTILLLIYWTHFTEVFADRNSEYSEVEVLALKKVYKIKIESSV